MSSHGLRFLYHTTLKRDRTTFSIPSPRQPGKAPGDLESRGSARLIAHAANPKHRTMILTTYAAGLRLNEVLHLRVDRPRLGAHDHSRGARQGRQRPLHGARGRTCWRPSAVLEWRARAPWLFPLGRRAADRPVRAATGVSHGETARGYHEARGHSRPAARVRDAPARSGRRHPHDPTVARARAHQHDDALLAIDASHRDGPGSPLDLLARVAPPPQG